MLAHSWAASVYPATDQPSAGALVVGTMFFGIGVYVVHYIKRHYQPRTGSWPYTASVMVAGTVAQATGLVYVAIASETALMAGLALSGTTLMLAMYDLYRMYRLGQAWSEYAASLPR